MRKLFNTFLRYFCYITTGTLLAVLVGFSIYGADPSIVTLWEILICSIPTTIVTIVVYSVRMDKFNLPLRILIHYISLCIIVGSLGYLFGWLSHDLNGIVFLCLCVAGVYVFTYFGSYLADMENAKNINKALEEKYSESQES